MAGLQQKIIINIIIMIKKSYSLYNVVSVREEFWVSPWFVSHAKNAIRGAYDDDGHFHCYIVEVRFFNAKLFAHVKKRFRCLTKNTKRTC